jgi:hypothetical protein
MAHRSSGAVRAALLAAAVIFAAPALAQGDQTAERGAAQPASGLLARQGDGSFAPVTFDPNRAPFGLRNNNWPALKGPNLSGRWPGQTGANSQGFATFDDPAYSVRAFIDLMQQYHDRHELRSAAAILRRYSPSGDCSGAPSVSAGERNQVGCPENDRTPPVTAVRVARVAGVQPGDDLDLFGADGRITQPDRLRALLDGIVTQEIGPSHCPQPPRGESWIGCRVGDEVFNRAVELLQQRD